MKNNDVTNNETKLSDDGSFDTGLVEKDTTSIFKTPMEPGEYSYHYVPHPEMTGILVVGE